MATHRTVDFCEYCTSKRLSPPNVLTRTEPERAYQSGQNRRGSTSLRLLGTLPNRCPLEDR